MESMIIPSIITFLIMLLVQSQFPVPQCENDPWKCPNPTQPAIQPCCCFGINKVACNNRTDCFYNVTATRCLSLLDTLFPTMNPTEQPTAEPSANTISPTVPPTANPSEAPTQTTESPTAPTSDPTPVPSPHPTLNPSAQPTEITTAPTVSTSPPTQNPSITPTISPSQNPSNSPSVNPSQNPSNSPSVNPSQPPSIMPTSSPSNNPSLSPSLSPSQTPSSFTVSPSQAPSRSPNTDPVTFNPTVDPTAIPTVDPTFQPTLNPTYFPTFEPTLSPTYFPTFQPTLNPTYFPSFQPTFNPTYSPIFTPNPTYIPSVTPTQMPSNDGTNCTECEIYNLTLTEIASNISIKECNEPNCECNGNGITSLTLLYIGRSTASKIEILYSQNNIVCSYEHIAPNEEIVCDLKEASDYRKFRKMTKYRIYFKSKSSEHYCVGRYDTSCETFILGQVYRDCPYLSVNGWTDSNGDICFNDGTNVNINYWVRKTVYSDSSNRDATKNEHSARSASRYEHRYHSSDSSRRRRRILNKHNKCIWNNNNNKHIRYLWDTNNDCGDGESESDSSERRSLLWNRDSSSSSSSSSSSEDDNDDKPSKVLVEVCLTYNIGILQRNCGALQSVFLPLCTNNETDFNVSDVGAEDVTDLIISYSPEDGVIPIGYKDNNGALGILAQFARNLTVFELCLDNVSMDLNTSMNYSQHRLDIADRVTFNISNVSSICASDGLPCLNFYFDKKCGESTIKPERNCDCDGGGLISISLQYSAHFEAERISVFNNRRGTKLLCEFHNISSDDIVVCEKSLHRNTYFRITYTENYGICEGVFRTDCSVNILGQTSSGCNALQVVGWKDKTESICEELIADDAISKHNALTNDKFNIVDALEVLNEVNIYVKWTLIGMMIMFAVLMAIALLLCLFGKRFGIGIKMRKMSIDETYVSTTDSMEAEPDAMIKRAIAKQKRHKSINFDEEEIVLECFYDEEEEEEDDDDDDVMKELRARSSNLHDAKHKSINLSEELILNRIWNECDLDDDDEENKNESQLRMLSNHNQLYVD